MAIEILHPVQERCQYCKYLIQDVNGHIVESTEDWEQIKCPKCEGIFTVEW